MLITCPSCAATYEVPEAAMRSPRTVRCARCGTNWAPGGEVATAPETPLDQAPVVAANSNPGGTDSASPAVAATAVEPSSAPVQETVADLAEVTVVPDAVAPKSTLYGLEMPAAPIRQAPSALAPPPSRKLAVAAGWGASFLLLGLFFWAGLHFHQAVMRAWPPSTRLYAVLGLYRIN